jgi:hypothetical protein
VFDLDVVDTSYDRDIDSCRDRPDIGHGAEIQIPERVVADKVAHRMHPELGERLSALSVHHRHR